MKKNRRKWFPEENIPGKFLRMMKLTLFLCCIGVMQVSAITYAQNATVSIQVKEASVAKVLQLIEAQSGYTFVYNNEQVNHLKSVSLDVTNVKITSILDECLKDTGLEYELLDKVIVINRRGSVPQEQLNIQGVVKDKTGSALPGVSIFIKGTTLGVSTDIDGKFKMDIPKMENVVLVFSFIGMETQEVKYTGQKMLNVVMKEDVAEMDEVVVNGYFTKNKESFTGSAVIVTKDELAKVSSNNLISALQVFDPSFRLQENVEMGSNPNSLPDFRIRGNSGFGTEGLTESNLKNDPNLPTFILDGYEVKVEKIFDLNMDRIESVTILKDASATAIYGSRAANGVVVVTTKAPAPGELKVSYNMNLTLTAPDLSDYNLLDAAGKLEAEKLSGYYDSKYVDNQQQLDKDYAYRLSNVKRGVDTYWLSQPLETAVGHKHSLYIEGGDKNVRYGIDVNYQANPGVMKKSLRDRYGIGFLLSYNLKDKFLFRNKLSVDKVKSKESPYGSFSEFAKANPYYPTHDENGKLIKEYPQYLSATYRHLNPLYEAQLNHKDEQEYLEFTNNFDLDWFISENFRLKGRVSYSERNDKREKFIDPNSNRYEKYDFQEGEGILKKGEAYNFDEKSSNLDANMVLTYTQQLGKHYLNGALGGNLIQNKYANESYSVIGFPAGNMDYVSFGKEFKDLAPDGEEGVSRLAGAFLNFNYTYNNIYLLDVSGRLDGSSQFGSDKRYAPFWSAGIGWNIHNEKFFGEAKNIINHLKITANAGQTGKASFSAYEAQNVFEYYKGQWYAGGLGASINKTLGNTDLEWEKTNSYDFNFEIQFLKGLISANANYYIKQTKDLLSDVSLPLSNGFESYRDNMGQLDNRGFELSLRGFLFRRNDLVVSVFGTMARNRNEIKKISNSLKAQNETIDKDQDEYEPELYQRFETAKPRVQFKEGESTTTIYAVRSLGINPTNGREVFLDRNGNMTYKWSAADKVACGDTEPTFSGAFGTNADYKGFNLSLNFLYQFGGEIYNQTLVDRVEDANIINNVDRRVLEERWKKPGDRTFFKDIKSKNRTELTTRMVQDENVLQLKSLSLSYTFPEALSKKWYMERLKLTFLMEDVFRVSNVKRERGLDYPFARAFNFGLQVQF
ncbi:MAG: SusC/RagA family TonB-linked outer membrane protein [Odoribacter sp.]